MATRLCRRPTWRRGTSALACLVMHVRVCQRVCLSVPLSRTHTHTRWRVCAHALSLFSLSPSLSLPPSLTSVPGPSPVPGPLFCVWIGWAGCWRCCRTWRKSALERRRRTRRQRNRQRLAVLREMTRRRRWGGGDIDEAGRAAGLWAGLVDALGMEGAALLAMRRTRRSWVSAAHTRMNENLAGWLGGAAGAAGEVGWLRSISFLLCVRIEVVCVKKGGWA